MKKNKRPKIVTVAGLTLITSILWVFFSVYRALTIKTLPSVPTNVLEELTPSLNSEVIDEMEKRKFFSDNEIPQNNIQISTPSATPAPELEINPSTQSATPASTESGQTP